MLSKVFTHLIMKKTLSVTLGTHKFCEKVIQSFLWLRLQVVGLDMTDLKSQMALCHFLLKSERA